ncbi:helix-turn-helix transcriptional regulator [Arthrobacter echini]|uniref:Helix-turn-helix transcriptional regulator n=1 Tax=Arthrobacter echini TaxID=1529066 RepID=A0A5D0XR76_9MICC|nr:LuxR C-terminal-related transcriptional regulator [Arthrobacter echini]TYC98998.1 helix-turn-helix transcriptional regulator [Arthrobacter echini]
MSGGESKPSLAGRSDLIREVCAALEDTSSFGALLVGDAGMGKTAVAGAVLEQTRWTAPVLRIAGGSTLRGTPFGAFAPFLHSLAVTDAGSPVAILRAVLAHLAEVRSVRAQQHLPLLVVDDAQELDDSSSALLAQLVSARRVKALVLVRESSTAPTEFHQLSADNLLVRFDLAPLDLEAVTAMSAGVLGGPVLSGTVHTLMRQTGGNPRLLGMILVHGVGEGYLEQSNGIWRSTSDRPSISPRLGDLVRSQLRPRSDAALAVLELIALVEPIALETLADRVDDEGLRRVQNDPVVVVGQGPEHLVSLHPPLYGSVLRHQSPAARSMAARLELLDAQVPAPQSPAALLRTMSWGLDRGRSVDDATLLSTAVLANEVGNHDLALRAARAVSTSGLRGSALLELARSHAGRGHCEYAQDLVDGILGPGEDPQLIGRAAHLSFHLKLTQGASHRDLRQETARWTALLDQIEESSPGAGATDDHARARLDCAILECHARFLEGRLDGLEEEVLGLLADPRRTAESRVRCLILLAELLATLGRSGDGLAHSSQALDLIEGAGASLLAHRDLAISRQVLLLTSSGRLREAVELVRAEIRASPRSIVYLAAWGDFVDGAIALRAARNREARDRFLLAAEGLRGTVDTPVVALLLGMSAYACALADEPEQAAGLVGEVAQLPAGGSRSLRLGGQIFATAASAVLGNAAPADLIELAAAAEQDRMTDLAVTARRLSLLLGDTSIVDDLLRTLAGFQGGGVRSLADFADAVENRDTESMVAAATQAGRDGDTAFEYAGLALALRSLETRALGRQTRALQRRLVLLGEEREGSDPVPRGDAPTPGANTQLTPTERKIVALVREGHSNREIAEDRDVSVRTVEGHLYRIFAKLGVTRRADLRES